MNIYFCKKGAHIHMRVFINGAKMGDLCCRADEFAMVQATLGRYIIWKEEWNDANGPTDLRNK